METLTSHEEQQLIETVKQAVDLVDQHDMTPDDAITKLAREHKLIPGSVRMVVSAYNNGRQVAQWDDGKTTLDKLASFPLAQYDRIYGRIWGNQQTEKQALHEDYHRPPSWLPTGREKLASAELPRIRQPDPPLPDPMLTAQKTFRAHQQTKRACDEARAQHAHAKDLLGARLHVLERYFQKFAIDRVAFHQAEDAAVAYHGLVGQRLFDHLATRFPKEKRASDTRIAYEAVRRDAEPYTFIDLAVKAARDLVQAGQVWQDAQAQVEKCAEELRPFVRTESPQSPALRTCLISGQPIKEAGMGGFAAGSAIATGTRHLLEKTLGGKGTSDEVDRIQRKMEDPDHENQLRKIRVQAMLNNMMSDPDNPISGYDPEEVLSAYNDLAHLAPRLAEQQVAIQPLLARRLAGHVEPFEVKEITDTEKSLRETRKPETPKLPVGQDAVSFD